MNNLNRVLDSKYREMCDTMNLLQKEAFEINTYV